MKLVIPFPLPGLNEYTDANRSHREGGNAMKSKTQRAIIASLRKQIRRPFREPVTMRFRWYEKDRRRDKDNISFAKKFILDALVQMKVLRNDGWSNIDGGFQDDFFVDKSQPRVEIEIAEADDKHG